VTEIVLGPGQHTFLAVAVDRAGNNDPTPATRDVSVVRRPRK
jgi:hypothetical protein